MTWWPMKTLKRIVTGYPEFYFIVLVLLSGYSFPLHFNVLSLVLAAIIIFQIIFQNEVSGIIMAGLFALVNLYMLFALISEFREFQTVNVSGIQLLAVGLLLIMLTFIACFLLVLKYTREEARKNGDIVC